MSFLEHEIHVIRNSVSGIQRTFKTVVYVFYVEILYTICISPLYSKQNKK